VKLFLDTSVLLAASGSGRGASRFLIMEAVTLDETDFHGNLGHEVYGMRVATPGEFLLEQRHRRLL
jgi:hypothetical protein